MVLTWISPCTLCKDHKPATFLRPSYFPPKSALLLPHGETTLSTMLLFTTLSLFLSASPALVMALGIEGDDIAAACAAICAPLVQLSLLCNEDDDIVGDAQEELLEADCICNNGDIAVADVTADCAACVADNIVELDDIEGNSPRYLLTQELPAKHCRIDIQEIALVCGF